MGYFLLDNPQKVQQYGAVRRGGYRFQGTIIMHTAECAMDHDGEDTSAEGVANYCLTRLDYGTYHRLCDSDSIMRMAPFSYEVWQDSETNPWAVGISAAVTAALWNTLSEQRRDAIYRNLAVAAAEAVEYAAELGISVPIKRITGAEARAGKPGFCAHGDSGIDRSDPGTQFDWDLFLNYVRQELAGLTTTAIKEDDVPKRLPLTRTADTKLPQGKWEYLRYNDDKYNNVSMLIAKDSALQIDVSTDIKVQGIPAGRKIQAKYVIESYDAKGKKTGERSALVRDIPCVDGDVVSWHLHDKVDLKKNDRLRLMLHSKHPNVLVLDNFTVVDYAAV